MGLLGLFRKKGNIPAKAMQEPEPLKQIDMSAGSGHAIKEEVEPELALWLSNGTTVKSMKELALALKKMKAADYKEQVSSERNDIAEWVQEVLNDYELARRLRKAKGKMKAAQAVEKEIKALKAGKTGNKAKTAETAIALAGAKKQKQPKQTEAGAEIPGLPAIPETAAEETTLHTELPPEPKSEGRKESRGFLFFRKKGNDKESDEPASQAIPEMQTQGWEAVLKSETPEDETATLQTESEPQHEAPMKGSREAGWEEDAGESQAAKAAENRGARHPKKSIKEKERKEKARAGEAENAQLEKRLRNMEKTEREFEREEEELNSRKLELTRRRYELIKQRGELEKERFEEFISKHQLTRQADEKMEAEIEIGQMPYVPQKAYDQSQDAKGLPDFRLAGAYGKERLEALLEEAKQHIRENSFAEAQAALNEVQAVFNTVYMSGSEKKQIEYEILEVEADLKLASLK